MTSKRLSDAHQKLVIEWTPVAEVHARRMARLAPSISHEDHLATALAVLVEIIPDYDERLGSLEGFINNRLYCRMMDVVRRTLTATKRERLVSALEPAEDLAESNWTSAVSTTSERTSVVAVLEAQIVGGLIATASSEAGGEDAILDQIQRARAAKHTEDFAAALSEPARTIFRKFHQEGVYAPQIARELDLSLRTVERTLANARAALRKLLIDEGVI